MATASAARACAGGCGFGAAGAAWPACAACPACSARSYSAEKLGDALVHADHRLVAELGAGPVRAHGDVARQHGRGEARQRRLTAEAQEAPRALGHGRERTRHLAGEGARGQRDPARGREARQDLADGALAVVGDEVRLAALIVRERQLHGVYQIGHVRGRGARAPAVDPDEATVLGHAQERRQHGLVTRAPHEARPHRDGLEVGAIGCQHQALGLGLGLGVEEALPLRVGMGLVHVDEILAGEQHRLRAHVHEVLHASALGCLDELARAGHVGGPELLARAPLAHERGAMHDRVHALEILDGHRTQVAHDRRGAALARGLGAVRGAAQRQHFVVSGQGLGHVSTNKTRRTRDEDSHI